MTYFTLQDVSQRSGLSEHTLRYYERIGLLDEVTRDRSSGHRRYTEEDLRLIEALACLRATGMSIEDMRTYRDLLKDGREGAQQQVDLFDAHRQKLQIELAKKQDHLRYLEYKVAFWKAILAGEEPNMSEIVTITADFAQQLTK